MIKKYIAFSFWFIKNFNNFFILIAIFFVGNKNHRFILKHKTGFRFIIENRIDLLTIKEVINDYDIFSLVSIGSDKNIVDIGGHKGYFSVFLSYLNKECNVFCYEPNPQLFNMILEHISLNKIKNCFPVNVAIGEKTGVMKFGLYGDLNSNAGTLQFDDIKHKNITLESVIDVEVVDINDILENLSSVDFLKIDCEGAEFSIFNKISNQNFNKIEKIICEFHEFGKNKKEILLDIFLKNNFLIENMYYTLKDSHQGIIEVYKDWF